jgi:PRTRC genetic system protein E
MNFLKKLAPLCHGGISFAFKVSAASDGMIQLDILPIGKIECGAGLPAKAITGTAEEIDAGLEQFLDKFLGTVSEVNTAFIDAERQIAAQAALAKEAAAAKVKAKVNAPKTSGATPKATPSLIGADNDFDGTDDDLDGDEKISSAAGARPKTSDQTQGGNALSADLFN